MRFNIVEDKVSKPVVNYKVGTYFKHVSMSGEIDSVYVLSEFALNDIIYFAACNIETGKFWRNPYTIANYAVAGLLPILDEDIEVIAKLKT